MCIITFDFTRKHKTKSLIKFGTSLPVKINNYYMAEAMKMRILIDSLRGPNFQYGPLR